MSSRGRELKTYVKPFKSKGQNVSIILFRFYTFIHYQSYNIYILTNKTCHICNIHSHTTIHQSTFIHYVLDLGKIQSVSNSTTSQHSHVNFHTQTYSPTNKHSNLHLLRSQHTGFIGIHYHHTSFILN